MCHLPLVVLLLDEVESSPVDLILSHQADLIEVTVRLPKLFLLLFLVLVVGDLVQDAQVSVDLRRIKLIANIL